MQEGIYTSPSEDSFKSDTDIKYELLDQEPILVKNQDIENTSFNDWMEEFARRRDIRMEVEGIPPEAEVEIPTKTPIVIGLMGDQHISGFYHDYELLRDHANFIRSCPKAYVVMGGDVVDGAFFNPAQDNKIASFTEETIVAKKMFDWLQDDMICACAGDHDGWSEKTGVTMYHDFKHKYKKPLFRGSSTLKLKVGNTDYKIVMAHRLPGHSMYNKTHPQNRESRFGQQGADVYVGWHCFDDQTEVITPDGWVSGLEVEEGDIVGTINKDTGNFEWNTVNKKIVRDDYKKMYLLDTKLVSICTTDDHGMLYYNRDSDEIKETTMKELSKMDRVSLPVTSQFKRINKADELLQRFLIWVVADGSIIKGRKSINFHLSKDRKIKRLSDLLADLDFEWRIREDDNGTVQIFVYNMEKIIGRFFPNRKVLGRWVMNFDPELVLEEYMNTDGSKNENSKSIQISSAKREEVDLLQEFFTISGYRNTANFNREVYTLYVNPRTKAVVYPSRDSEVIDYEGLVWCLSVDNGSLFVRRNGKVVATQNTHQKGISQQVSKMAGEKDIKQTLVSPGAYKYSDAYSQKLGFAQQSKEELGAVWLVLHPDRKEVEAYWNMESAKERIEPYMNNQISKPIPTDPKEIIKEISQ